MSDAEIDPNGLDKEIQIRIDFEEEGKAEVPLNDLLGMCTKANNMGHKIITTAFKAPIC
jgi:hypothetical protein